MVEVKIFEDGELVNQIKGEAIFAIAMGNPEAGVVHKQSTIRGDANVDLLFRTISSACAKHMASLSKSEDDGCRIAGEFVSNILNCSVEYLGEKYGEDMEDGSIEN